MKDGFSNTRSVSYWTNRLAYCFDNEIKVCDSLLADLEKQRKELAKKKLMLSQIKLILKMLH